MNSNCRTFTAFDIGGPYFDSNASSLNQYRARGASRYGWLYNNTNGCESNGCSINDSSNNGYWTASAPTWKSDDIWYIANSTDFGCGRICGNGVLSETSWRTSYGIRPVIKVAK